MDFIFATLFIIIFDGRQADGFILGIKELYGLAYAKLHERSALTGCKYNSPGNKIFAVVVHFANYVSRPYRHKIVVNVK